MTKKKKNGAPNQRQKSFLKDHIFDELFLEKMTLVELTRTSRNGMCGL